MKTREQIRYEALSRDWNRMRDTERQWMRFHKLAIACAVIAGVVVALTRVWP